MKQFIYLDTDIVSSIIAQAEKGLITQMMSEQGSEKEKKQQESESVQINTGIKGTILGLLNIGADLGANVEGGSSKSVQSSSKDIVEKTLHDAAFDIAYDYIKPHKSIAGKQQNGVSGEYIELKRVFSFVDFSYLEGLFQKGGVIDSFKKIETQKIKDEIAASKEGLTREQKRQKSLQIKTIRNNALKEIDQQFEDVAEVVKILKGLVPYSRMLTSFDGYLIPLDDKYFRIDPSNLGFKYGGELTCVGLITNIIGESTDPGDSNDVFATIQHSVNEILRSILPTKNKDLCVVHPIAVYYE